MIQLSALPVPTAATGGDEAAVAAQAGAAQGADFGALLAIEAGAPPAAEALSVLPSEVLPALPQAAIAASVLPESGKTLPVALPVALPPVAAPQVPADPELADPAKPVEAHAVQSLMQALRARPGKPAETEEPAPQLAENSPAPAASETAETAQVPLAVMPGPVLAAQHSAKQAEPASEPAAAAVPAPSAAAAPAVLAALPKLQREGPAPRAKAASAAPLAPAAAITPLVPAAELAPVASLKVMPASNAIAIEPAANPVPAAAAPRAAAMVAAPILREEKAAPELALASPQSPAAPLAAPQAAAAPEPRHDFAALVDRIAAARDASGVGAVSVAVAHSDFGQVQLRFRHQEGTLSVAMASADPDFARAVSAMPPVIQPVSASAETTTQFSAQSGSREGPTAQGGGSFAQSRGSSTPDRREPQHGAANPAPPRSPRGGQPSNQGIFA